MPELPEVETIRRLLSRLVANKTIERVEVYRAKNIIGNAEDFASRLQSLTLKEMKRKGKWLAFVFSPFVVLSHLRMEGKYFFEPTPEERGKHDILRFFFTDGSALLYQDVRKFGRLELIPESELSARYAELGEEPFDLTGDQLWRRLQGKRIPLKQAIMDQTIVAGIGNIYADETLFACKLNPLMPANKASQEDCDAIIAASRRILTTAIEEGGSTIRSYHPGKGINGAMQLHLNAYGRSGLPCPRCGAKLRRTTVNNRGTAYCPICQKNPQKPFVLGITGPIHVGKTTVSHYFVNRGYLLFDADKVAHEAYDNPVCKKKIAKLLGEGSYRDGTPNWDYIRAAIAASMEKKKDLEAVIHPYVIRRAKSLIKSAKKPLVLDVPLLFPSGMDELCNATLLVVSSSEKQKARLEQEGRDASSLLKINASYPLEKTKEKADFIVENDAGIEELYHALEALPFD